MMPTWSPSGALFCVTDRGAGWWNIWAATHDSVKPVLPAVGCEFASPAWSFGRQSFIFLADNCMLAAHSQPDTPGTVLSTFDPTAPSPTLRRVACPYSSLGTFSVTIDVDGAQRLTVLGASPTKPAEVATAHLHVSANGELKTGEWRVLKRSMGATLPLPVEAISEPETVEYPTEDGTHNTHDISWPSMHVQTLRSNTKTSTHTHMHSTRQLSPPAGKTAFALFYAPKSAEFVGPGAELPPLLVKIHGGNLHDSFFVDNPWDSKYLI
jgi:hypothetical protein